MDLDLVARQLVRAVRGTRSQRALSLRLGYRTNPVAEWEGGRRFPTAAELFRACERVGIDVIPALEAVGPASSEGWTGDDASVARWLRKAIGEERETPIGRIAASAGLSRHVVSRVLSGRSRPRLPQLLALIDALDGRLTHFVDRLVGADAVPELAAEHRRRQLHATLMYDQPWTAAISTLALLDAYQALPTHVDGWFAARLGIPVEVERAAIAGLVGAGTMVWRDGRLAPPVEQPSDRPLYDPTEGPSPMAALCALWAQVASERCRDRTPFDAATFSWLVVSRDNYIRIADLYRQFMDGVVAVASEAQPGTRAVLLVMHIADFTTPR